MSKLTTSYNTATIESTLTKKQLETAQAYAKNSNVLYDDKENPVFMITASKNGSVSSCGIAFDATTADGKMFYSFTDDKMPAASGDRKTYLQDLYGSVLFSLNAVETQINAALESRAGQISAVADSIVIG